MSSVKRYASVLVLGLSVSIAVSAQIQRLDSRRDGLPGSDADSGANSSREGLRSEMRNQGVKRAMVLVEFLWEQPPTNMEVVRTLYYDKQSEDCSQITEQGRLASLRAGGFERKLGEVALQETASSTWFCTDSCIDGARGLSRVDIEADGKVTARLYPWPRPSLKLSPSGGNLPVYDNEIDIQSLIASPQTTSRDLDLALVQAPMWGDDSCVVDMLLKAGAHVNAHDENGYTALTEAAEFGRLHDLEKLLKAGADINARDGNGDTALMKASRMHHGDAVEMLLRAGADPSSLSSVPQH